MSQPRPPFDDFPVLRTPHLVLDQVTQEHMADFEELAKFSSQYQQLHTPIAIWEMTRKEYLAGRALNWGLFLDGQLIGTCGFYRGFNDNSSEIGYVMRAAFRRKGYMREAVEAIIDYGQKELNLDLISAYTTDQNEPSKALLLEQGFVRTERMNGIYRRYELATPRR